MTTLDPMAEVEQIRKLYGEFSGLYDPSQAVAHVRELLDCIKTLAADLEWHGTAFDRAIEQRNAAENHAAEWKAEFERVKAESDARRTADAQYLAEVIRERDEHRDRAEAAHNLHANAERLLAEARNEVEDRKLFGKVVSDGIKRREAELQRLLPVVEAAKAWRAKAAPPNWHHLNPAVGPSVGALITAVDALGTDAADGAGTGEIPLMLCPRGDGHALMITELTFTCPKCAAQIVEPAASPAGSSTADEGDGRG